jgi:hypothetical protein
MASAQRELRSNSRAWLKAFDAVRRSPAFGWRGERYKYRGKVGAAGWTTFTGFGGTAGVCAGADAVRGVGLALAGASGVTPIRLLLAAGAGGLEAVAGGGVLSGSAERNQFNGFNLFREPVFPVVGSGGVSGTGVPTITGSG